MNFLHVIYFSLLFNLNNLAETSNLSTSVPRSSSRSETEPGSSLFSRIDPVSPGLTHRLSSNTLLINKKFDTEWRNLLLELESIVIRIASRNYMLSVREIEAQNQLLAAINANNQELVAFLISNGVKFLSNVPGSRLRTVDYVPLEMAVILDRDLALDGMLQYLELIDYVSKGTLFGGLLIRAVQAGHLKTMRLLIEKYNAPYLTGSFLLQQSLMHKSPVDVVKYFLTKFGSNSECSQPYGRHQDFPFHLAIKYNNFPAFIFLFYETGFNKNIMNGDNHSPIDLILNGPYEHFLIDLFKSSPQLRFAWTGGDGNTFLHLAALHSRFEFMTFVIQTLKFPVDCSNSHGQTALLLAAINRKQHFVSYLLDAGASIFQSDRTGMYPLLFLARQNDFETFKLALETISNRIIHLQLISIVQILIHDQNWLFLNYLLSKFAYLTKNSYLIPQEHLKAFVDSEIIWDLPVLLDFFIKCQLIDSKLILFQAVTFGKLEIVKIVLENGVQLNSLNEFDESIISLAIKNNQTNVLRFLLSFGGWLISEGLPNSDFISLITNGGSFSSSLPSRILFESRETILSQFIKYFLMVSETLQFNPKVLATVCIQLEIFLFHYVSNQTDTPPDLLTSLTTLINIRKIVAESFLRQFIQSNCIILSHLLCTIHFKNHYLLRRIVSAHQMTAEVFIPYIDPMNFYLIEEYDSITSF